MRPAALDALRRARDDRATRAIMLGTAGTVALNVAAVVLNLGVVLLLSRRLGTDGFGAFASAYAWAGVLSVIAVLGLTPLVVRQVAAYRALESWGMIRGLLRRSNQSVLLSSALTIAIAAGVGRIIYDGRPELLHPFWIALLLVPLIALTSLRQAAMQGLGRVVLGRVPETLVAPSLFIVLALMAAVSLGSGFTASWAASLQVAAALCALLLGALLLRSTLPGSVRGAMPEYETASWRRSGLALVLLNVVMAVNAQIGTILLGALRDAGDAGVFNVAARTTTFISFVMLAVTYPLMPVVARLHATGRIDSLQRLIVRAARGVLVFALPTALALLLLAPVLLGLFGSGFDDGATAVRILAVGELANVLTGFGGVVLVMTGHERELALSVGIGAVLNVALSAILIPIAGLEGAAVGTAASLTCANAVMAWLAWRRVGVWSAVVGRGRRLA